jgi:AcrR family transcriptional regulator
MDSTDRRAKAKTRLHAQILDAARGLFTRHGYEAVTMRAIGREIGYTATALYYHFPNKESLLLELCENDFRKLSDSIQRLAKIADPVERTRQTGIAYVDFGLRHPQHYRLMFMTPRPEPEPHQVRIERGNPNEDGFAFLMLALQESIDAHRLRPEFKDANLVAQVFWACVHGVVSLHLTKRESKWIQWHSAPQTAELMINALLRGLERQP